MGGAGADGLFGVGAVEIALFRLACLSAQGGFVLPLLLHDALSFSGESIVRVAEVRHEVGDLFCTC